jgi:hypothetical protein
MISHHGSPKSTPTIGDEKREKTCMQCREVIIITLDPK